MTRMFGEMWVFFWRDLCIARTYRTVFVLEAIEALFGVPDSAGVAQRHEAADG